MTAEELNELITEEGVDRVSADLIKRGYYVKKLAEAPTIAPELLVTGALRMLDSLGMPLAGHVVTVETLRNGLSVLGDGGQTYYIGESQSRRHYELNADGVLILNLVKGSRVIIHVEGGFSRELTVPTEDFDVLSYDSDDSFVNPGKPVTLPIRRV